MQKTISLQIGYFFRFFLVAGLFTVFWGASSSPAIAATTSLNTPITPHYPYVQSVVQQKIKKFNLKPKPITARTSALWENSTSIPVLFIHGLANNQNYLSGGCDAGTEWGTAMGLLSGSYGYDGMPTWNPSILRTIGYMQADYGCTENLFDDYDSIHCLGYFHSAAADGTWNEDIRHIACEFSWYIWDYYSSQGQPVDIVAHSMGGLITRWMLYATPFDPDFPPYILVQNVVTMATPHGGINNFGKIPPNSLLGGMLCDLACNQILEMQQDQPFMQTLIHGSTDNGHFYPGQNPQGYTGTYWTMMGSPYCDVADYGTEALPLKQSLDYWGDTVDMYGGMHILFTDQSPYVQYNNGGTCYQHGDYLTDRRFSFINSPIQICIDSPLVYCSANIMGGGGYQQYSMHYGSLAMMHWALTNSFNGTGPLTPAITDDHVFVIAANHHLYDYHWNNGTNLAISDVSAATNPNLPLQGIPSASSFMQSNNFVLDVYVTGSNGHLYEFWYQYGSWHYGDLTYSSSWYYSSAPSAISFQDKSGNLDHAVFGTGTNGNIYFSKWIQGIGWKYINISSMAGIANISFYGSQPNGHWEPFQGNGVLDVYAVATNGHLWELYTTDSGTTWQASDLSQGLTFMGTPSAYTYTDYSMTSIYHLVYVLGTNRHLYELLWSGSASSGGYWSITDISAETGITPALTYSPNAHAFLQNGAVDNDVYVTDTSGVVWEFLQQGSWTVVRHPANATGSPSAYSYHLDSRELQSVFYCGSDGRLHEWWYSASTGWIANNVGAPSGTSLQYCTPSAFAQ